MFDPTGLRVEPVNAPIGQQIHPAPLVFRDGLNLIAGKSLSSRVGGEAKGLRVGMVNACNTTLGGGHPQPALSIQIQTPD